jgi:hypothetical protein
MEPLVQMFLNMAGDGFRPLFDVSCQGTNAVLVGNAMTVIVLFADVFENGESLDHCDAVASVLMFSSTTLGFWRSCGH